MYKKISKREARKQWAEGHTIYLVPCKLRIGYPWNPEISVSLTDDLKEDALRFKHYHEAQEYSYSAKQYAHLWKGSIENTAWDLMYNNWAWYNTSYETGYYAHYYIRE